MLSIKNLKQKRSSKKLSHKYVESFKIENKIEAQIYRLTLSNIYRIHNIFHVSLLKSYRHRVDDKKTKQMMQTSNFIDDEKQWKIEEIVDKIEDRKSIWYKMKWLDWDLEYNQWLLENDFDKAIDVMTKFNEQSSFKRKRRK